MFVVGTLRKIVGNRIWQNFFRVLTFSSGKTVQTSADSNGAKPCRAEKSFFRIDWGRFRPLRLTQSTGQTFRYVPLSLNHLEKVAGR